MKQTLFIALIIISLLVVSCTPPGAQPISELADGAPAKVDVKEDTTSPDTTETPQEKGVAEEPSDVQEKETEEKEDSTVSDEDIATDFTEKKEVCSPGTFSCKDTRLIECRSGKLIMKEDCGARGCYVDHCGECDPDVPIECDGNKLVKCTKDARKKTQQCYRCQNNACVDPPENPEPFSCARITNIETDDGTPLSVFSPFKKSEVDQELVIKNDVDEDAFELGRLFASGSADETKGGGSGKSPVYVELDKCYIYCGLELPLTFTLTCDDNTEVKATIPPHTATAAKPIKFFIGEDGSTYFGDADRNGQGVQLDVEDIFKKSQLAVESDY